MKHALIAALVFSMFCDARGAGKNGLFGDVDVRRSQKRSGTRAGGRRRRTRRRAHGRRTGNRDDHQTDACRALYGSDDRSGRADGCLKLDGTESKNTIGMGPATSKAVWDGPRLVIYTKS